MLAAFTFNTTENLPVGLLGDVAHDLRVPLAAVGALVTGYGVTVAVFSLPLARAMRAVPHRYVLAAVLAVLVVASRLSAVAGSYGVLLGARVATALAQALFWAVMGPAAVGLFAPERRGRVIGVLSVGGSLATALGVPAGTWLGRHGGWHAPFAVLACLGAVALVLVAACLPTTRPGTGHAAFGPAPDRRAFGVVLATTALSGAGAYTGFTYIEKFLTEVSGFPGSAVGPLLLVFGVAALAGIVGAGPLLDRLPWAMLAVPVALQSVAMTALWAAGGTRWAATAALALLGVALAPVVMASQALVLRVAPGRTETAVAANSAAFNAGVALGALTGGLVLPLVTVRGTFLIGALWSAVALALQAPRVRHRAQPG
ncbi:MFS transporter [Streptomyces sp. NBC_01497]|uniref:MFS transporter n=1 Tax=Streptomyces sp. NBC_01497 TaxID=2903885 RepID=UPI002E369CC5|nr:MFS transporter [Streptomyces sp. NBC_01497]